MPPPIPRINPNSQRLTQEFIASQENVQQIQIDHGENEAQNDNDSESMPVSKVSHYCIFSIILLRMLQ